MFGLFWNTCLSNENNERSSSNYQCIFSYKCLCCSFQSKLHALNILNYDKPSQDHRVLKLTRNHYSALGPWARNPMLTLTPAWLNLSEIWMTDFFFVFYQEDAKLIIDINSTRMQHNPIWPNLKLTWLVECLVRTSCLLGIIWSIPTVILSQNSIGPQPQKTQEIDFLYFLNYISEHDCACETSI